MIGEKRANELAERVLWLIEEYVTIAGLPKSYGTDMLFHRLDIHLINSIGENDGINVTELAAVHRITKSAVSQAVKKLEKRELVERYQSPDNRKEVRFRLTPKGRTAFDAHRAFHNERERPHIDALAQLDDRDLRGAYKLISILEERAADIRKRLNE